MQTLLEKVTSVEEDAQDRVKRAQEAGEKALHALLSNEERALDSVRRDAEKRVSQIVTETITKTENEINALRQQGESSIKMVHSTAEANRSLAMEKAWRLFQEEYLN